METLKAGITNLLRADFHDLRAFVQYPREAP
jgi:hypothetical protein